MKVERVELEDEKSEEITLSITLESLSEVASLFMFLSPLFEKVLKDFPETVPGEDVPEIIRLAKKSEEDFNRVREILDGILHERRRKNEPEEL